MQYAFLKYLRRCFVSIAVDVLLLMQWMFFLLYCILFYLLYFFTTMHGLLEHIPQWQRHPVGSLSLIACSLEHVKWWERRPPISSSLSWLSAPLNTSHDDKDVIFVLVSPWLPVAHPLEEHTSHDNNDVLLVDFVVWPFLCQWCWSSYIKCKGQQNVLITALQGCQNKMSDDIACWLLTLFVSYQQQSLPFRLLSCLCELLSIKSR